MDGEESPKIKEIRAEKAEKRGASGCQELIGDKP